MLTPGQSSIAARRPARTRKRAFNALPRASHDRSTTLDRPSTRAGSLAGLANANDAPSYGAVGYGYLDGLFGETTRPGCFLFGDFGVAGEVVRSGYENGGVFGYSKYGAGMLAEGSGYPSLSLSGAGLPIGLYAVADTNGATNLNQAIGIVAESNSFPLVADNTNTNVRLSLAEPTELFYGINTKSGATLALISDSGSEDLAGTLTTSKGRYARTIGASARRGWPTERARPHRKSKTSAKARWRTAEASSRSTRPSQIRSTRAANITEQRIGPQAFARALSDIRQRLNTH